MHLSTDMIWTVKWLLLYYLIMRPCLEDGPDVRVRRPLCQFSAYTCCCMRNIMQHIAKKTTTTG